LSNHIDETTYDLFLGAILHDIGKFYMRTGNENIRKIVKQIYQSEKHQYWGDYFLNSRKELSGKVVNAVKNHHSHSTNDMIEMLVAIADKLSANDREEHRKNEEKEINTNSMQLIPVFYDVYSYSKSAGNKDFYKIPHKRSVYVCPENLSRYNISKDYQNLWNQFEKDFDELYKKYIEDKSKFSVYVYHLLEEYTFNIPSACYFNRPSISLWAHIKTTAAIAISLYNQLRREHKSERELLRQLEKILNKLSVSSTITEDEFQYFSIIKGDISGIQDFVYDTDTDGASKALKGKSFYISFLMDTIAKYIIKNENLSMANILMCGGGHFYILAPRSTMERIEEYQEYIEQVLYTAHNGKLSVLLGCAPIALCDFISKRDDKGEDDNKNNISAKFDEATLEVQKKKLSKYRRIVEITGIKFFMPSDDYQDICPRCFRVKTNDKCTFCESFIEIGDNLAKRDYLCDEFTDIEAKIDRINGINDVLTCFGRKVNFTNKISDEKDKLIYLLKKDNNVLYPKLNISTSVPIVINQYGHKIIKELDDIASASKGVNTWAVLRGDVDNLGRIFKYGLGENPSISKLMTLSEEFSTFFSIYLDEIISREKKWKENIIVLYSGGDDFCLIGPWSEIPKVAYMIRQEFGKYTLENPYLTISMGIEIAPDVKYPVYRVAIASGENLEHAKEHINEDGSLKNCFAVSKQHIIEWKEYGKL